MIKVHSFDDVAAMVIPEREDVVKDLLPRGDAVLLSAREKSGKGFLMVDAAVCVASGEPFLQRAVLQGSVIYLALEEGKRTVRDRLRARAGDVTGLSLFVAFLDGSEDQTFRLDDHESISGLRDLIVERQPVLVVLDVLREAHDGRENESDDMAVMLRPIRQLAHERNVCIVVTHHASKAGGFRGSTSIPAAFDDTIEFIRDDLETDTQMRGLLTGRGRDLPKVAQYVEFDPATCRWNAIEGAPTHSQPTNIREKIVQVLNSTDEWLTAEGITEQLPNTKLQTVRNKLADMIHERPCKFVVEGSGSKGNPRKYHRIHKRDDIGTHGFGNNPGVNGHRSGKLCIDCDKTADPGQLYCPDHGGIASDDAMASTGDPFLDSLWDVKARTA